MRELRDIVGCPAGRALRAARLGHFEDRRRLPTLSIAETWFSSASISPKSVYFPAVTSTRTPREAQVREVIGPIEATQARPSSSAARGPSMSQRLSTVLLEVKVTASISPDSSAFASASARAGSGARVS